MASEAATQLASLERSVQNCLSSCETAGCVEQPAAAAFVNQARLFLQVTERLAGVRPGVACRFWGSCQGN